MWQDISNMDAIIDGIIIAFAAAYFRNYFAAKKETQRKEEALRIWQTTLDQRLDGAYEMLKEHIAREIMCYDKIDRTGALSNGRSLSGQSYQDDDYSQEIEQKIDPRTLVKRNKLR